jgi:hypothetical protein
MPIGLELCAFCKHFTPRGDCAAFPGQIPAEVFYVAHDHRLPYPGDHGVRFEIDPDLTPGQLELYREHYGGRSKGVSRGEE